MGTRQRVQRVWAAVVAAQAGSGETPVTFCRRQGIVPNLFYRWRTRLWSEATPPALPLFVQLRPVAVAERASSGVTVVAAGGWRFELAPGFDAATLERALACVQTQVACSG